MENQSPAPSRPANVRRGVLLLAVSLALGIPRSAMEWPSLAEVAANLPGGTILLIITQLFSFGVVGGLLLLTWIRHNWARWVYTVLTVLGFPFAIMPLVLSLKTTPVSGVIGLLQVALQLAGLFFLFKKESSAWFKWRKPKANESGSSA